MNADYNKYGTLVKDYDREYLDGDNNHLKTLHDIYNLLKGWNKPQNHGTEISIQGRIII